MNLPGEFGKFLKVKEIQFNMLAQFMRALLERFIKLKNGFQQVQRIMRTEMILLIGRSQGDLNLLVILHQNLFEKNITINLYHGY